VGANATIVPGITLGRYCFISAGAVVTRDVPDYAMMKGVPAKRVAWMSRHGHVLVPGDDGELVCPESGLKYEDREGELRCLDIEEIAPLPENMSIGKSSYRNFK
jgi:UDP-2-acetamido-3-amino-2,3-dideoxy-glucuronate N-acetyltransferase